MDGSVIPVLEQPIDLERGRVAQCCIRARLQQSGPEPRIEIHLQVRQTQDARVDADQALGRHLPVQPARMDPRDAQIPARDQTTLQETTHDLPTHRSTVGCARFGAENVRTICGLL